MNVPLCARFLIMPGIIPGSFSNARIAKFCSKLVPVPNVLIWQIFQNRTFGISSSKPEVVMLMKRSIRCNSLL